jgi:hypothetical protein
MEVIYNKDWWKLQYYITEKAKRMYLIDEISLVGYMKEERIDICNNQH